MDLFLRATSIIDWENAEIRAAAQTLANRTSGPLDVAQRCFEWVRDQVRHSHDYQLNPVTCVASDVLRCQTGFCYAKSHLLAALLRANGIPAGFCYQRLSRDGHSAPFCLHGLNAVYLPQIGWYRIDARGNRSDVDAQFTPPTERLAFTCRLPGEAFPPAVFPDPLDVVLEALRTHPTWDLLWENLPDVPIEDSWVPRSASIGHTEESHRTASP